MASLQEVKEVVGATFGLDPAAIPDDAAAGSLDGWDSMGHLELMLALEARWQLRIAPDRMLALHTLEDIAKHLQSIRAS